MKSFTNFEQFLFFRQIHYFLFPFCLLIFSNQLYGQNATTGGSVDGQQVICPGQTPAPFVNITHASGGGTAPIEYLWMTTTSASNPISGWNLASGINNQADYSPPPLGSTTYFIRCARRQGFSDYSAESNIVVVNVASFPTTVINGNSGFALIDEVVNLTATYSIFATYQWDFDEDGITDCSGQNCSFSYTSPGAYNISLTVDNGTCAMTTTSSIFVLVPLPVEFISFEGKEINQKEILLKWVTGSENKNNYFEIERSLDGNRFDFIGSVASQGNSSSPQAYSFMDENGIEGKTYYRLKQVDFDGNYSFSNIISVSINNEHQIAKVIPNPIEEKAIVRFSGELPQKAKLQIITPTGQIVQTYKISENSMEINLFGLEKGVYFLRIKNASKIENAFYKIVKL